MTEPYRLAHLDDVEPVDGWLPLRRKLGITAFGVNAWRPQADGRTVIGEHDEATTGHEELYVVVAGHATFTVDGDEIDAPTGTLVFVRDPSLKRSAVARDPETTILSAGGKPGEAYAPLPWEENAEIIPLFGRGEYAEAKRRLEEALERHPDAGGLLYNLACAEARLGETDAALAHLERAIEVWPGFREAAMGDPDFEAIRDDPRFPR
ncbi:MAG: tetratricopeptide repeat protein [Actinomycetota bacterium]|nr:tetratricopeptide repeat protein [Actinomycetota bacterium]